MPSKDIHQATTLIFAGSVYALSATWGYSPKEQMLAVSGILTGVVITPDMDLAENFKGEPFWYLYGRLFKHRGISHWPVIGTLTRMIYMVILAVPVVLLMGWGWWLSDRLTDLWSYVWLGGLVLADVLHYVLDISVSRFKKWISSETPRA